ncbi:MAG: DUF2461 domain-containing protein [Porphyromonadaceae bacterium]|nr:DUF2461 domain-containing protein [Porphyromonadaceae bacterium]
MTRHPIKVILARIWRIQEAEKANAVGIICMLSRMERVFFSAGVWSPEPNVLKALRKSIFENYEEFDTIRNEVDFRKNFGNSFYEEDKLKRVPVGFPSDFKDPEILKLKHYLVSHDLADSRVMDVNLLEKLDELAKSAFPLNKFLNFTIDEMI